MKIFSIPGINGLGNTRGCEKGADILLRGVNFEKVILNLEDIEIQQKQIKQFVEKINSGLFVGGDHSISFPIVSEFFKKNKNLKLIVFDAHPDLMKPMNPPTHEEWLRALFELGFPTENILIVGVRKNSINVDKREISFAEKNNIKIIYSNEIEKNKNKILEFISSGKFYISLDIDVFDCSLVNCTGYCEKDGLNEQQVFEIIKKVKNLVGFDLVEINFEKGCEESKNIVKNFARKILKEVVSKSKD